MFSYSLKTFTIGGFQMNTKRRSVSIIQTNPTVFYMLYVRLGSSGIIHVYPVLFPLALVDRRIFKYMFYATDGHISNPN